MWVCDRLLLCGQCFRPLRPVLLKGRRPLSYVSLTFAFNCKRSSWISRKDVFKDIQLPVKWVTQADMRNARFYTSKPESKEKATSCGETDADNKAKIRYHRKLGALTVLVTASVGVITLWWELQLMKQSLKQMTSHFDGDLKEQYQSLPLALGSENEWLDQIGTLESPVKFWFPWIQSKSQDPFVLLELCRSDDPVIRHLGVKALAEKTLWEDYQYRYVAQAADHKTLIALSRTEGVDQRFFLPQPKLADSKVSAIEDLATMLLMMEEEERKNNGGRLPGSTSTDNNVAATAQELLKRKHQPTDDDMIRFWGFDGSPLDVASLDGPLPEDQILLEFLAAVCKLCNIYEQALLFMKTKGLALLQRLLEEFENTETRTAVAAVLGNLALHADLHRDIVRTGWLGVLKKWTTSRNSSLAVNAARVLANLDAEFSGEVLEDGILVLYPLMRSRKILHADVIFLHGLLGGAIKTWRQRDAPPDDDEADNNELPRTDCWPKDWLAEDFPHTRIISVHYDTSLSSWSSCSGEKHKCTLEGRSRELIEKLGRAGVGKRPIIWAGHSMGGLLIKQMLNISDVEPSQLLRDHTCGVLLFAVPHKGLSIAALTSQIHYILYPSVEVQELRKDAAHLSLLHSHFKEFIEANKIPCLSFGETDKTRFQRNFPKLLLVPEESSNPGFGEFIKLQMDHINICKPESPDSVVYQKTVAFIQRAIIYSYIHRLKKAVKGSLESLE